MKEAYDALREFENPAVIVTRHTGEDGKYSYLVLSNRQDHVEGVDIALTVPSGLVRSLDGIFDDIEKAREEE